MRRDEGREREGTRRGRRGMRDERAPAIAPAIGKGNDRAHML